LINLSVAVSNQCFPTRWLKRPLCRQLQWSDRSEVSSIIVSIFSHNGCKKAW